MLRSLTTIVTVFSAAVSFCAEPEQVKELRKLIQQRIDNKWSVGIAAAYIDKNGIYFATAGTLSQTDKTPVDKDSVFEIGSVSKAFTGVLLAEAVQRGELKLNDEVSLYLPNVKLPSRDGQPIRLLHLTQHTSGLPYMPDNLKPKDMMNPFADYTVEQLYACLAACKLARTPGAGYEYSNLATGLLGHTLALKANCSYEELLLARICQPLEMKDTRIALTPEMRKRLALGHNEGLEVVKNWDIISLAGAGGIRSTASDVARFVAANMGLKESKLQAAFNASHGNHFPVGGATHIALGWHISKAFGTEIIWHNGRTGGYQSFAGFIKDQKKGIVVLSNCESSIDDIGMHLLESKHGLNPKMSTPREERTSIELKPEVLQKLTGDYELVPGFVLTITAEGNRLMAQATGQPKLEVYPESEFKFFYKAVDAQITFDKDITGNATGLTLHQNGANMPAKKLKGK